jgi:DNA-binding response OmpR family regulator
MHVLIVEDDAAPGQFLDCGLKLDGHQVTLVTDGESALSSAEEIRPELILLDMGLALKDGLQVLTELSDRFR